MHMAFYQIFDCIQEFGRFPMYNEMAFMALVMVAFNVAIKKLTKSKGFN